MSGITVIGTKRSSDGWLSHDLSDERWFIWEKPEGVLVMEYNAGYRGSPREREQAHSVDEALELAAALVPSTPEEILAEVPVHSEDDRRCKDDLIRYGQPGTRLWILPVFGENGYSGMGQPATALGLGVIRIEALFGSDLGCWVIRYRTDTGDEGDIGPLIAMTAEEAEALWWVVDGDGNLVTGGHSDRERMITLAAEKGGQVQLGLGVPVTDAPKAAAPDLPAAGHKLTEAEVEALREQFKDAMRSGLPTTIMAGQGKP